MEDTWASRDLPVLDATVRLLEGSPDPEVSDLASETGLAPEVVARALRAMNGAFLDLQMTAGDPESWFVRRVYPSARQVVGQWPTPDSLIARLADGFSAAADHEADPEKKKTLRSFAAMFGGAGRDIAVDVAARIIEHRIGLG